MAGRDELLREGSTVVRAEAGEVDWVREVSRRVAYPNIKLGVPRASSALTSGGGPEGLLSSPRIVFAIGRQSE